MSPPNPTSSPTMTKGIIPAAELGEERLIAPKINAQTPGSSRMIPAMAISAVTQPLRGGGGGILAGGGTRSMGDVGGGVLGGLLNATPLVGCCRPTLPLAAGCRA